MVLLVQGNFVKTLDVALVALAAPVAVGCRHFVDMPVVEVVMGLDDRLGLADHTMFAIHMVVAASLADYIGSAVGMISAEWRKLNFRPYQFSSVLVSWLNSSALLPSCRCARSFQKRSP